MQPRSPEEPSTARTASSAPPPPHDHAGVRLAQQLRPPRTPGEFQHLLPPFCARFGMLLPLEKPGRLAPARPRRAEPPPPSSSTLRPSPCPSKRPGELHVPRRGQPTQTRVETTPGASDSTISGEPSAAPPRTESPAVARRRPARPKPQDRPICFGRTRLDLEAIESEPLDRDLEVHVRGYQFACHFCIRAPDFC